MNNVIPECFSISYDDKIINLKFANNKFNIDTSFRYDAKDYLLVNNEQFEIFKFYLNGEYTYKNDNNEEIYLIPLNDDISFDYAHVFKDNVYLLNENSSLNMNGNGVVLFIRKPKYYIGLDVGGTNIKGMIIDDLGHVVISDKVPTDSIIGYDQIINNMNTCFNNLLNRSKLNKENFKSVGVGFPGTIDNKNGIVVYSNNINIKNKNVCEDFKELCGIDVLIDNDANLACLGEYLFTSKRKMSNMVFITLGTGVGSGIIIDSKLFRGGLNTMTELGHMRVKSDKVKCTCGEYGCLEALISLKRIKEDILDLIKDKENNLYTLMNEEDNPLKIFDLEDNNQAAKDYAFKYQNNLLLGLINICNIFQPEAIVVGGGVSYVVSKYFKSLEYRMNKYKFGGFDAPKIKLMHAKLGNDAGSFGACALTIK